MDNAAGSITAPIVDRAAPAFSGQRWNGWALFAIAILGILLFAIAQTIVLFLILFHAHPDLLPGLAACSKEVQQDSRFCMATLLDRYVSQKAMLDLLTAKNLWYSAVSSELLLLGLTLWLARLAFHARPNALGLGRLPGLGGVGFGIGVGFVLVVASSIVEALQNSVFGYHPPQFQAQVLLRHHGVADFLYDLSAVSIAAPLAEETFFRGLIFTGLSQRMAPVSAAIISALFFGLAHFELWSLLPIFVIGLGLAYAYYKTRSLWVSMTAHATVNAISLVIAYAFPQLVK